MYPYQTFTEKDEEQLNHLLSQSSDLTISEKNKLENRLKLEKDDFIMNFGMNPDDRKLAHIIACKND